MYCIVTVSQSTYINYYVYLAMKPWRSSAGPVTCQNMPDLQVQSTDQPYTRSNKDFKAVLATGGLGQTALWNYIGTQLLLLHVLILAIKKLGSK